jgi:vancomycin permeability regulator SanA
VTWWIKRYSFWLVVALSVFTAVLCINAADIALLTCAPVAKADAALVLGSSVQNGEPSPIFKGRLDTALDLYKRGIVSEIMVSGGVTREGEPSEAQAGAQYLLGKGVRPTHIVRENAARSTHENIALGTSVLSGLGLKSWIVVSDPYHLRRAQMLAEDMGMPFDCVAVPQSSRTSFSFLMDESRKVILMRLARIMRWIQL